jgi:hypothetical protein
MGSLRTLKVSDLTQRKFFLYLCRNCGERLLTTTHIYTCTHCGREFLPYYSATMQEITSTTTNASVATQLEHTASITWLSERDHSLEHLHVRWHRCGLETHKAIVPDTWSLLRADIPILTCPVSYAKNNCVETRIAEKATLQFRHFEAILGKQFWLKRYNHRPHGVTFG